ncbi:helix-turn-helix transcriptional regulator [Chitinolyticbacter albus]|uniref:helix-turn-helix transcriptional regulator n=1 Tax=Chitinolyticbacter albus TaxID=2961951 RepID=UPI00210CADA9|nr:PAS domain-containing protein [Chitinolyticbacter albus]
MTTVSPIESAQLAAFAPLVDGIAALLGPRCEVVLHSLATPDTSIVRIANGHLTGRTPGMPATDVALEMMSTSEPWRCYFSRNRAGASIKSLSTPVRDGDGRVVGMLCVNLSMDMTLAELAAAFTPQRGDEDGERFVISVDELIAGAIAEVDRENPPAPARNGLIVERLFDAGIFAIKDAAQIVARKLAISRHTVYLHLRRCKARLVSRETRP